MGANAIQNTNLIYVAPFSPQRKIIRTTSWQANDPLLHHLLPHLKDETNSGILEIERPLTWRRIRYSNIGLLNERYRPWAGNPVQQFDPSAWDPASRDAGVRTPDNWKFPQSRGLDLTLLGQIHRGTPWQTLNLKSEQACSTTPETDATLVSIILEKFNPLPPAERLSINSTNENEWAALFEGLTVVTNDCFGLGTHTIHSNSPRVSAVMVAIQQRRERQPGHYHAAFESLLATPELSLLSPWITWDECFPYIITDEALEMLPAQLLPKLREDAIGRIYRSATGVELRFRVIPGSQYALELSENLRRWTEVEQRVAATSMLVFGDAATANQGYYRLRLQKD